MILSLYNYTDEIIMDKIKTQAKEKMMKTEDDFMEKYKVLE